MSKYQHLIDNLAWVADLDDIDHDICDTAREAQSVIQLLAENEKRLRDELDQIRRALRT